MSKAIDTISQKILLLKLKYYKFSPSALSLVENYLSDRTLKVNLNGTFSKTEWLTVGVPQGSVLGPLLFIIFINDFCAHPILSALMLFADDSITLLSGKNIFDVVEKMNYKFKIIKK